MANISCAHANYLEQLAAKCIELFAKMFKDKLTRHINDPNLLVNALNVDYTKPRKRWINAIDKTINRNFVTGIRNRIN